MSISRFQQADETAEQAGFASGGPFRILLIGAKASIILFVVSALLRF